MLSSEAILCSAMALRVRALRSMALRDAIQCVCLVMRSALTPSMTAEASTRNGTAEAARMDGHRAEAKVRKQHQGPRIYFSPIEVRQ